MKIKHYYLDTNKLKNTGLTQTDIVKALGVSKSYISDLCNGKTITNNSRNFKALNGLLTEKGEDKAHLAFNSEIRDRILSDIDKNKNKKG